MEIRIIGTSPICVRTQETFAPISNADPRAR